MPVSRVLKAGGVYFLAVFAFGFVLGVLRTLFVAPRVGVLTAVVVELPIILSIAWWVCTRLLRRSPLTQAGAVVMGATAFVLLMLAEAALSIGLFGRTLRDHLAIYADVKQLLGLAGQIAFAAFPWVQTRRSGHHGAS
jgi:hypothetical protein